MSVPDPGPEQDDPRIIRVSDDEEQWPGLLEVGSEIIATRTEARRSAR